MIIEVNAIGLGCPQPVIKTREALSEAGGNALLIMVDNAASRDNVVRFLTRSGATVDRIETHGGEFHIYTTGDAPGPPEAMPSEDSVSDAEGVSTGGYTTVFINKDRIGHGSDELGDNLMSAFINTLKDLEVQPKTLCFMNSGVLLSLEGAETLASLKALEERGMEMLVCGTCLNYFNVSDKCRVGVVSNMYDISEAMLKASKVITV